MEYTYKSWELSNKFDSFNFVEPSRDIFHREIEAPCGMFSVQIGIEPGKIDHWKGIEDRAIGGLKTDGSWVFATIDGVGETWIPPAENRSLYTIDGRERILGDIPGFILSRYIFDSPSSIGMQDIVRSASSDYQDFLLVNGFNANRDKETFGGCTFATAVLRSDGLIEVCSIGDTIAVVVYQSDEVFLLDKNGSPLPYTVRSTPNQLPEINRLLETKKAEYYSQFGAVEGRNLFNEKFKKIQRNKWANSPNKYGFFDGNMACADLMHSFIIKGTLVRYILLLTDGAFDSSCQDMYRLEQQILDIFFKQGIKGLLAYNQQKAQPEATAVLISRL
jgi:hypothetical protein